jgi:hypothetical protein
VFVLQLNDIQANTKRKRKSATDENLGVKAKNKRYRRGCVADEVPSTIILDNDDEDIDDDEPGEILNGQQTSVSSKVFQSFDYQSIDEEKILSTSEINDMFHTLYVDVIFVNVEKFKRPADDEDIYEPNRPKKSSTVKVKSS